MRALLIILIFFILGALFIISNNELALYEEENLKQFSELYSGWVNNIYNNLLTMTGEAVKLSWIPDPTSG